MPPEFFKAYISRNKSANFMMIGYMPQGECYRHRSLGYHQSLPTPFLIPKPMFLFNKLNNETWAVQQIDYEKNGKHKV